MRHEQPESKLIFLVILNDKNYFSILDLIVYKLTNYDYKNYKVFNIQR